MPFALAHEYGKLVRQSGDLSVHRTHVATIGPRELPLRGLEASPQVPFPKAERGDLDRGYGLHFILWLGRCCAKCRDNGGEVSRQVRSRMLPSLEPFEERS